MTTVVPPKPIDSIAHPVPDWMRKLHIIDVDAHFSEPYDLWTRHAPKGFEDRLPRVAVVDGVEKWVFDGIPLSNATSHSVIMPGGAKAPCRDILHLKLNEVDRASWDWRARLDLIDDLGIWAQILYPNVAGFGNQTFMRVGDASLRAMSTIVYNDAMAEIQEGSKGRLLPMALLPWWDIDASVKEIKRIAKMGYRGICMSSDPQDCGLPELHESQWDPLWKACSDLGLPVSFHVGASDSALSSWWGSSPWPKLTKEQKFVVGGIMLCMANARIVSNFINSAILERFPELKIVSVESGTGWVAYFLEAMDYYYAETKVPFLKMKPSEYFHRQVYTTFWFEKAALRNLDVIGVRNVMFETDVPHACCLYPNALEHIAGTFADISPEVGRRVLQDNAAELYRIDLSKVPAR